MSLCLKKHSDTVQGTAEELKQTCQMTKSAIIDMIFSFKHYKNITVTFHDTALQQRRLQLNKGKEAAETERNDLNNTLKHKTLKISSEQKCFCRPLRTRGGYTKRISLEINSMYRPQHKDCKGLPSMLFPKSGIGLPGNSDIQLFKGRV